MLKLQIAHAIIHSLSRASNPREGSNAKGNREKQAAAIKIHEQIRQASRVTHQLGKTRQQSQLIKVRRVPQAGTDKLSSFDCRKG